MARLNHIAIIPDGNRRFAKKSALDLGDAYFKGFQKVGDAVTWSLESNIRNLTFWGLSYDNLNRSNRELDVLFSLMNDKLAAALKEKSFEEKGVKVKFIGNLQMLPGSINEKISKIEEKTCDGKELKLNVALAYGGIDEILQASRKLAESAAKTGKAEVSEAALMDKLYLNDKIDLVIRTGKYSRMSGFMPLQCAYSELFFCKKLWPEFSKPDFLKALEFYNSIQRNFGK